MESLIYHYTLSKMVIEDELLIWLTGPDLHFQFRQFDNDYQATPFLSSISLNSGFHRIML